MAGCTTDMVSPDSALQDKVPGQELYSDVPIEFGYGGMTKADIGNTALSGHFGLFSKLKGTDDLSKTDRLNFRNRVIRYENDFGFRFGYASEDRTMYYPASDEEYSFYAYYTYQHDSLIRAGVSTDDMTISTRTKTYIHMKSFGTPCVLGSDGDVLWSKAESYDVATATYIDGFNADIVKDGFKPVFTFGHPVAVVSFTVSLAENTTKPLGTTRLRLEHLWLMNSPYQADLCIVDVEEDPDKNMEGRFENLQYTDEESKVPFLRGATGNRNLETWLAAGDEGVRKVPGRKGYMVIVPQDGPLVCRLRLGRYSMKADGTYGSADGFWKYDVILDPDDYLSKDDPGYGKGYQAGMVYNYNIVVDYRSINPSSGVSGPYVKGELVTQ